VHPLVIAIIPARYQSIRLPGKALADIAGRTMIEHVYRRAAAARTVSRVIVATDDQRIADTVAGFGGEAVLTSASHQSGTDRLAEVAASLACDVIVNVQGDEPVLAPETIDAAVEPFLSDAGLEMTTLRRRITDPVEREDPNVTKVVVDREGFALYFSRAPIPFTRPGQPPAAAWAHIGLYVYRRDTLLRLAALPQTTMERAEALEQLRAVEHGIRIKVVKTAYASIGVDTPEDLARVRALFATTLTT
jgi:3-deoxy-manno-octulosonate cytidylyltransferase (CMP-KDO synthetase)